MSLKSLLASFWLGLCLFGHVAAEEPATPSAGQPVATAAAETGGAGDEETTDMDEAASEQPRDVILVLDNSGSMKNNDPQFLTGKAVREFVSRLQAQTRLAIIIFDQDVHLAMPLSRLSDSSRERISASLERINYKGLFTDSPAAIERAIYELKNNGREDAQKFIVFMTDGIVDTGNEAKDLEKTRWLREDLAPDAADAGIRIFGIAFTEDADFQLIQSLAQKTDGEYYRVLKPEDLPSVFERIQTLMQEPPEEELPAPEAPAEIPPAAQPQQPVVINVPEQPVQSMDEQDRIRSIIIIASAGILVLALVVIIVLLIRHNRSGRGDDSAQAAEAYLNDIHGHTSQASYKLGSKPTMLGRVAGKDTDHLDYIVIPQSTIGRRHALIEYKDFAYWIVDQGSINGTYVNDMPISSEVRLKHGDRIRLHKLEFEFIMPEMDEAGMTELSHTVFAQQVGDDEDEATALKATGSDGTDAGIDLDLGLGDKTESGVSTDDEEEATLVREDRQDSVPDTEDETLIPGSEEPAAGAGSAAPEQPDDSSEDATLMPGEFELPDEDETLRPESLDESLEDFFDVTDVDKKKGDDRD